MLIQLDWNRIVRRGRERLGERRFNALALLALAGLAALVIHGLGRAGQDRSALLYLAVPYGIAVLITLIRPYQESKTLGQEYVSHTASALVVFLGSSVLLAEGFLCVLFFMPIYFAAVTVGFVATWLSKRSDRGRKVHSLAIPLLVALLSTEGTSEKTSFDRHNQATAAATTALAREELLQNLRSPIALSNSDDWMLGLFPMPHAIEAGSLEVGDIHRVHMRYHRWFVTNTHDGAIELRIDAVSPERVSVSFLSDTSYFASYVKLLGSEIEMKPAANGSTEISLTLSYERRLDPAWYFHPIQQYAMRRMAEHLIEEVLIRG